MGSSTRILVLAMALAMSASAPTSPELQRSLQIKGSANIFVVMSDTTAGVLDPLSKTSYKSRGDQLTSVANALKSHASVSQKSVLNFLSSIEGIQYTSFWINNQIYIKDATAELVDQLAYLSGISEINEEISYQLEKLMLIPDPELRSGGNRKKVLAEPGVEKIQAPLVWAMSGGTTGEGIVVADMTTGVRRTHEALRDNFVGDYGWFDPVFNTAVPDDRSGIGTYSAGLMAGSGGIGVAPGAKWMACRGCGEFSCSQSNLLICGQFMACPTTPGGGTPNCTKAPHVVVNNWGGGGSAWYDQIVTAWHTAGIIPVFVVGVSGPSCGSAGASDNVIAVGAVNLTDSLSPNSSRGPSPTGQIKPDIVGPGVTIRSSYGTADDAYMSLSSTTPASCLVAGTIALLKGMDVDLAYAQVKENLFKGADTDNLIPTGGNCGGIPETVIPNNAYGYGRVNAYKSVMAIVNSRSG